MSRRKEMRAIIGLCLIITPVLAAVSLAMSSSSHVTIARQALTILGETAPELYAVFEKDCMVGTCPEIAQMRGVDRTRLAGRSFVDAVAEEAELVDFYQDIEFVKVRGLGDGRDDPHVDEAGAVDDRPHYEEHGMNFTSLNHFIDIKKGRGTFDDYDGYAYYKGSACREQYMRAAETVTGWARFLATFTGMMADEGMNWWLKDQYVHVKSDDWYRGCSPAIERYSFPEDGGIYLSVDDELRMRFPLARSAGADGCGVPYSVFMPVDNMARYWYVRFLATRDVLTLGPVLHAVQDASVPHHAAGYCGNWHSAYEHDLALRTPRWLEDPDFVGSVKETVAAWNRLDPSPPDTLAPEDWTRTPALNWRIDQLVTWVALNAYRQYEQTYLGFRDGYTFDEEGSKDLTRIATAMSILVLMQAGEAGE